MKCFRFIVNGEYYCFSYDDVKVLIEHLVDLAEEEKTAFSLLDVFAMVRILAHGVGLQNS